MSFVYDDEDLPDEKVDLRAPGTPTTNHWAAGDYNALKQALEDIRTALLTAEHFGFADNPAETVSLAGHAKLRLNGSDLEVSIDGDGWEPVVIGEINVSGTNTGDVSIGTSNGLSVAVGQVVSLAGASGVQAGAVTLTAQTLGAGTKTVDALVVTGDLTADTNTLFVDSADNAVGIGTLDPLSKLHVEGSQSGTFMLRLRNLATTGASAVGWLDDAGTNRGGIGCTGTAYSGIPGQVYLQSLNGSDLVFLTGAAGSGTERMRLSNAGVLNIASASGLTLNSVAVPTVSSTSTLTNKTLTSPAITSPTITGTGTAVLSTLTSSTANPASAGILRLARADTVGWRNQANGADLPLGPGSDNILEFNSVDLVDVSTAQTLTNKTVSSPTFSGSWSGSLTNLSATNIKDSTRCYARYTRTTTQSIGDAGSPKIVNFATQVLDSRSAVTTGANWQLLVPAGHGGLYRVRARVRLENTGVPQQKIELYLYKNGSLYSTLDSNTHYDPDYGSAFPSSVGGDDLISLAAGDTIDIRIYQEGGSSAFNLVANGAENYVSIIREVTDL